MNRIYDYRIASGGDLWYNKRRKKVEPSLNSAWKFCLLWTIWRRHNFLKKPASVSPQFPLCALVLQSIFLLMSWIRFAPPWTVSPAISCSTSRTKKTPHKKQGQPGLVAMPSLLSYRGVFQDESCCAILKWPPPPQLPGDCFIGTYSWWHRALSSAKPLSHKPRLPPGGALSVPVSAWRRSLPGG